MEDLYQILGIPKSASLEEIKRRYRFLVKAYHPDRFNTPDEKSEAEEEMKRINAAYQVLSDRLKRSGLDGTEKQNSSSTNEAAPEATKSSEEEAYPNRESSIYRCNSCFRITSTNKLTFHRNIGVIFMRFYTKVEGNFCAECAEYFFWKYTAITLFVGWLGIISLIITPFLILMNIGSYVNSWGLRKESKGLFPIALGWKVSVITLVFALLFLVINVNSHQVPSLVDNSIKQLSATPTTNLVVAKTISPQEITIAELQIQASLFTENTQTPTPVPSYDGCHHWSEITVEDKHWTRCVYGTVFSSIWERGVFYLKFDSDKNAFRFIVRDGYFYKGLTGECVIAKGVVRAEGKMLYIELNDNLYSCDNKAFVKNR